MNRYFTLLLLAAMLFPFISSPLMAQSDFNFLVWSDECDGEGMIDTSKWFHQTLLPNGTSWYNGEIQHYTDREENAYLEDGSMVILAIKESFTDQGVTKEYTSARLNSKFAFTYGRVEVRAKLPQGVGTWPAIWMLGQNITEPGGYWAEDFGTVGWPACGEIDIMEHWGTNQNYVQSALHTPSSFGGTVNHGGKQLSDVSNTFHTYALEWSSEKMEFSVDGDVYYTYDPLVKDMSTWPFDANQYMLLNIAIQPSIDPNFTQSPMVIDYVRVYQETPPLGVDFGSQNDRIKLFPNPSSENVSVQVDPAFVGGALSMYSVDGRMVHDMKLSSATVQVDLRELQSGVYSVQVKNIGGEVELTRLVVN